MKPGDSVVIAGSARDRWHGTPYQYYGARAVVQVTGGSSSTNGCGSWSALAGKPLGSSGVVVDGLAHDGTLLNGSLAGRIYHGVAVRLSDLISRDDGSGWMRLRSGTVTGAGAWRAVRSAGRSAERPRTTG